MSLEVLRSAQKVLAAERMSRREDFEAVVARARAARLTTIAAAELAFRNDEVRIKRVGVARDAGDATEDLVGNLLELSVMVTDDPDPFKKLGMNVDEMALELAAAARELEDALARYRSSAKSAARDRRDRVYTLAAEAIAELRAFAEPARVVRLRVVPGAQPGREEAPRSDRPAAPVDTPPVVPIPVVTATPSPPATPIPAPVDEPVREAA